MKNMSLQVEETVESLVHNVLLAPSSSLLSAYVLSSFPVVEAYELSDVYDHHISDMRTSSCPTPHC
jgi:hypothetical protein